MGKQMIKRKDGSYSQRGLWDNIRANKGSGKKPTAEMLKQEKKIKNENKMGGKRKLYKKGGKSEFGMLSVKAGVDNNPNPTAADRIVGAKKNKKQKGGLVSTGTIKVPGTVTNVDSKGKVTGVGKALPSKKKMKKGGKKKMMGGGMKKMYQSGGFLDAPSVADLDNL
jgi:hypothetical protein